MIQTDNNLAAECNSSTDGKEGARRIYVSSGSYEKGKPAPADVSTSPAFLHSSITRFAVCSVTFYDIKYPPAG